MCDTEVAGYPNQPTYKVALWIDNDPLWDQAVMELVDDALTCEFVGADEAGVEADLATDLRGWVEGRVLGDEADAGLSTDLLQWAIEGVDWVFLARHYLDRAHDR